MNTTTTTTTEKSMTMREFLTAVSAVEGMPENLVTFAHKQIEQIDKRNSSRSTSNAKKKAEVDAPLMEQIVGLLTEHPNGLLTSEVATALGLTSSKVAALGKKMVEQGLVTSEKVKVPKVGERVKFTLIQTEGETE